MKAKELKRLRRFRSQIIKDLDKVGYNPPDRLSVLTEALDRADRVIARNEKNEQDIQ